MIYIDNAAIPYRGMKMCHMIADSEIELLLFAHRLGLNVEWFHGKEGRKHFNVCRKIRKKAIELGAKEVTTRELILLKQSQPPK